MAFTRFFSLFLAAAFVLLLYAQVSAQNQPEARLHAERGWINCEVWTADLDGFFGQLLNDPTTTGLVVIQPGRNEILRGLMTERSARAHAAFRRIPMDRIVVVRGAVSDSLNIRLWIVPIGAAAPKEDSKWPLSLEPAPKRVILYDYSESGNNGGICPDYSVYPIFAEYMRANPTARGNIVIKGPPRTFARKRREVLKILTKE